MPLAPPESAVVGPPRANGSRPELITSALSDSADRAAKIPTDDWLLWQLADSGFPSGGFAHSGGLEAAWQHQEVRNSGELEEFVRANLVQLSRGMLPFVLAAHERPDRFMEWDSLCDAFLTNHVANRASRLQGRALSASVNRIFGETMPGLADEPECGHLAPIFGAILSRLKIETARSARLFVFWQLRGWLVAAVRLGIIGPMEAQAMQLNLAKFAEDILSRATHSVVFAPAQTAPLLDLWQAAQDRAYSRLFQS